MKIDQMPDSARIWIYIAQRPITAGEKTEIANLVNAFLPTWAYHGDALYASFEIMHDHFLVLALHEELAPAGGCAIDKSIHLFKEIDRRFDLNLFDRMRVGVQRDGKMMIMATNQVEMEYEKGVLVAESPVFDGSLHRLGDLRNKWPQPLSNTWMGSRLMRMN